MANAINIFKSRKSNMPMQIDWRTIGPKEAQALLDTQKDATDSSGKRNRVINTSNLNKITSDMKAGRFLATPEAIIIDENGRLRNGQHRLNAVVNSNTHQQFLFATVTNGDEITDVIDIGQKRSLSDMLEMAGSADPKFISSMASLIRDQDENSRVKDSDASKHIWLQNEHPDLEKCWLESRSKINYAFRQSGGIIPKAELFYHLYMSRHDESIKDHTVIREFIDYLINEPKGNCKAPSPKYKFLMDALRDLNLCDALTHKYKRPLRFAMVKYLCAFESKSIPKHLKSGMGLIKNKNGFIRNSMNHAGIDRKKYTAVWSKEQLGLSDEG